MRTRTEDLVRDWAWVANVAGVALFAAFTAITAHIRFFLPFTPVPITLQVLAVILSGLVLGSRLGMLSQMAYVAAGVMGLPVFASCGPGPAVLACPAAGYLVGFVACAFVAGAIVESRPRAGKITMFLAGVVGVAVLYAFGVVWLGQWLSAAKGLAPWAAGVAAWEAGVAPFILVDLMKAAVAAAVAGSGRMLLARMLPSQR